MTFNEFFHNNRGLYSDGEYINLDQEFFYNLKPMICDFMVSENNVFIIDGDKHHDTTSIIYSTVSNSINDGHICIVDSTLIPHSPDKKHTHDDPDTEDTVYATIYSRTGNQLRKQYYTTWSSTLEFINDNKDSLVLIVSNHTAKKSTPYFYKHILNLDIPKVIISSIGEVSNKHLNGTLATNRVEFYTLPKVTLPLVVLSIAELFERLHISYDDNDTITAIALKSKLNTEQLNRILHTLLFQMYLKRSKHICIADLDCFDTPKPENNNVRLHNHIRNFFTIVIPVVVITVPVTVFLYPKWNNAMVDIQANDVETYTTLFEDDRNSLTEDAIVTIDTDIDTDTVDTVVTLGTPLLELSPEVIPAPQYDYAIVAARVLNLRNQPSLNSDVILQSPRNSRLEVIDSVSYPDWVQIRTDNGVKAWVSRDFVILRNN